MLGAKCLALLQDFSYSAAFNFTILRYEKYAYEKVSPYLVMHFILNRTPDTEESVVRE